MTDRPDEGNDKPDEPPAYGDPNQPPAYVDPNQPPAYGDPNQPSAYVDPNQPPAYGNSNQPPAYGDPNQPPAYGYPGQQPGGGYPPPPAYPSYGGQPPPYQGQQMPGQVPGYPPAPAYGSPDPNAYLGAPVYPGYPGGEDPNARRRFSGLAIAALVTGLLIPILGLFVAVPLGIVALVKISHSRAKGRWMAITGIVVSTLWWVGVIAFGIWAYNNQAQRNDAGDITEAGSIAFNEVRIGDCINIAGLSGNGSIDNLKGVPCSEPHNAQAYWIATLNGSDYPGEAATALQARRGCAPRYAQYAATGSQPYYVYPTSSIWDSTDGKRAICFIIHDDKQPWTGSVVR